MSTTNTFTTMLPSLTTALHSFQSSSSRFAIVHCLHSSPKPPTRLLILDSSFNPPHLAHKTLITAALSTSQYDRLLLLLSVNNADKAPAPAPFAVRLTLMALFAADLRESIPIDIGLTTEPFYNAKSAAIEEAGYASGAKHTHLMGFDTLARFMAPRYYKDFDPPLSALNGYFGAGHGVRVTIRPGEGGEVEAQRDWRAGLAKGEMESMGAKREWAGQVTMVEAGEGEGVSSTLVRKAAEKGESQTVEELCTPSVARALREEGTYANDKD